MGVLRLWPVGLVAGMVLVSGGCAGDVAAGITAPALEPRPFVICRQGGPPLSANPLFVVDGVVFDTLRLRELDPESVESVEVLKGPAAAAIYGRDARAGVVLIRTKGTAASGPAAR